MSTQLISGVAGAVIGAVVGSLIPGVGTVLGAQIGFAAGGLVGSLIDPTVQRGPSLNDRKLQTSEYGAPLPYIWGTFRASGVNDWQRDDGVMRESGGGGGGKGGGGGDERPSYTHSWSLKYCRSTVRGATTIDSITKHWCDGRVVPEGDINPTVYIGWSGQLPDESIEADLGVGEVPANRFMASEVYNEVGMDQFFNRLPNMEALIVTTSAESGPILQVASNTDTEWAEKEFPETWTTQWETDGLLPNPSSTEISGAAIYLGDSVGAHRLFEIGRVYMPLGSGGSMQLVDVYFDYAQARMAIGEAPAENAPTTLGLPALSAISGFSGGLPIILADIPLFAGVEVGRYVTQVAISPDYHTMIIVTTPENPDTNPTTHGDMWHRIVDGALDDEGTRDYQSFIDGDISGFGFGNRSRTALASYSSSVENNGRWIWTYHDNAISGFAPAAKLPIAITLAHIEDDGTMVRYNYLDATYSTNPAADWWLSYGGPQQVGNQGGCLVTEEGYFGVISGSQTALYTRLAGTADVTLATVVGDVLQLTGSPWDLSSLDDSEFDVSEGESTIIHGVAMASQMQRRNFIEMLRQAYFFDLIESDDGEQGILKLVMRARAAGTEFDEIPSEDLGYGPEGDEPRPLIRLVKHLQDAELPGRVVVKHYDTDQDYLLGSQSAQFRNITVDNETAIDLPIAMSAGEARAIARRHLVTAWIERDTYAFTTSWKHAVYEPSDVVVVEGITLRITKKVEHPYSYIEWEGVPYAAYVADQPDDAAPGEGSTPVSPPSARGATTLALFDVAMVVDGDEDVGFYAAMAPTVTGSTWTGAGLYKSTDGGTTYNQIDSTSAASTMGTVESPLADFTGGNVFDYANVIRVEMLYGELESVTELAALGGANAAILGNEIIGFTTATLVSDGVYDLTGLLRGQRGTEWAMTSHQPNEYFALHATCLNVPLTDAEVDQARHYKAVTFGTTLAAAEETLFTCHGVSARCYTPVHLAGGPYEESGSPAARDILIEFLPRTRRGGAWRDFVDITQADTPAEYVVEIWDATYTLCARVISGLSSPTTTYTADQQTADFGAVQSEYYVTAGQVGRFRLGLRAQAVIPGGGSVINDPLDPTPPYNGPSDPGGSFSMTLTQPADTDHTTGFVVGDTLVVTFTTGGSAPIDASYISVGPYSALVDYGLHIRLTTDLAGTALVGESYNSPVASLQLGDLYSWSLNLSASTTYYLHVTHRLPNGDLGGPAGAAADLGVTLLLET